MLNSKQNRNVAAHKKGITLVEVLVVIAMFSTISVVVVQMMGTGRSIIGTHQELMTANSSALVVDGAIKQNLKFATQAKLIPAPTQSLSSSQIAKDIEGMQLDKAVQIHYIYNGERGMCYEVYDNEKNKIKEQLILDDPKIKVTFQKVAGFNNLVDLSIGGGNEQTVKSQVELTNFPQNQTILGVDTADAMVFFTWAE